MELIQQWLENTWMLALESAPWLLIGLIAAGLIRAWVPMQLVARMLGGKGAVPVTKAALIGAPLPLCSCSVLPAAISLRRGGASKASTTSFLIATPETGVDSVALSWVLLGPWLAIIRPITAVLSAVAAGLLVGRIEGREPSSAPPPTIRSTVQEGLTVAAPVAAASCTDSACNCACTQEPEERPGFRGRTQEGLGYAFTTLLDDLSLWLALAIAAAGAVITLFPGDFLASWGSGLGAMLAILAISVPMYVCATASTPLAHAMLFAGVSPGTVLVFLLAGPASNIGSLAIIRRELGGRALAGYLAGVAGMSLAFGLLLDQLIATFGWNVFDIANVSAPEEIHGPIALLSLLVLLVVAIRPLRRALIPGKTKDKQGCCS